MNDNKNMKSVICLIDDEMRSSEFMKSMDLGFMKWTDPMMCMVKFMYKEIFVWKRYGLFIENKNFEDYLAEQDGIIIFIDISNCLKDPNKFINKITHLLNKLYKMPILILIEGNDFTPLHI